MNPILFKSLRNAQTDNGGWSIEVFGGRIEDSEAKLETMEQPSVLTKKESKPPKIILVFDTETSGLLPKTGGESKITEYPFILQLSFVLYDMQSRRVLHKYNKYIRVPDHVIISQFITNLTGITREICNAGVSIISAIQDFYRCYKLCDAIVAHNISFDRQMIEIEIIRNYSVFSNHIPMVAFMFNSTFLRLENKQLYCTMAMGRNVCNLMVPSKTNPANSYKKNPKLEELYEHLFQEKMPNAHDAVFDVEACLRSFVMLKIGADISR